jgi:hypothetical protein
MATVVKRIVYLDANARVARLHVHWLQDDRRPMLDTILGTTQLNIVCSNPTRLHTLGSVLAKRSRTPLATKIKATRAVKLPSYRDLLPVFCCFSVHSGCGYLDFEGKGSILARTVSRIALLIEENKENTPATLTTSAGASPRGLK